MNLLSGELEPTATYTHRSWTWVGRTGPAAVHDGVLRVNFVRGATGRAAVETRAYLVQEVAADFGRLFLFLKAEGQPDPNESDIYEVRQTDFGVSCTCKAHQCKAPGCVHKDVLPALIEAGAFDGGPIDPPADPPVTEDDLDAMADAAGPGSGLWFPPEPPADDDRMPACFDGVGTSGEGCPF